MALHDRGGEPLHEDRPHELQRGRVARLRPRRPRPAYRRRAETRESLCARRPDTMPESREPSRRDRAQQRDVGEADARRGGERPELALQLRRGRVRVCVDAVLACSPGRAASAPSRATLALLTLSTRSQPLARTLHRARKIDRTRGQESGSKPRTCTPAAARSAAMPHRPRRARGPPPVSGSRFAPAARTPTVFIESGCPRNLSESETELLTIFSTFRQYAAACDADELELRRAARSDRPR